MTEITVIPQNMYLPAMNVQIAIQRRNELVGFVQQIMKSGTDYGKIPGAGDKPTLLKPGAEKLTTFFGLSPSFRLAGSEEDWDGVNHNGEPFFYYRYSCELYRNGNMIANGEGSCNSHESKYRYRKGERVCPECGAAAIIKGKADYGGGWLCFGKKGGCGAKFKNGDPVIESQETGRILNADVADQVNTFQKMAQKRALIAATLLAVNASEFFTQDIEDMVDIPMAQYSVVEPVEEKQAATTQKPKPVRHRQPAARQPDPVATDDQGVAGDGMSPDGPEGNIFDDDTLWADAADIVETLTTPKGAMDWAVNCGYTENQYSAKTRWEAIVREQFDNKFTPAKFKDIAINYVVHYLAKGVMPEVAAAGK